MPVKSKRDHIVDIALGLFYANGFHATGIERIIDAACVSKKTLYKHFRSKEELILATLRKRDELFRSNLIGVTEQLGHTASERLLTLFDALDRWFNEKTFSGCMFINAAAEFSAQNDPCYEMCVEHKRLVVDYIRELATEAGYQDPNSLAEQLNLLMEGAIVEAHVSGKKDAALKAKNMARVFLQATD